MNQNLLIDITIDAIFNNLESQSRTLRDSGTTEIQNMKLFSLEITKNIEDLKDYNYSLLEVIYSKDLAIKENKIYTKILQLKSQLKSLQTHKFQVNVQNKALKSLIHNEDLKKFNFILRKQIKRAKLLLEKSEKVQSKA